MAPVKPGFRPSASVHQSRPVVPWRHAKQHTGFRCAPALAALNQGVGNEAVSIDSARQPMALAVDRAHELVEMPLVAELRGAPTDLAGAGPAHCLRPAPHGFVAGSWLTTIPRAASRSSTIRRLSGKRTKSQTACSMTSANDVRREPVATINGCRTRHHRARTADVRRHVVNLTGPS
jgi:hypothetical protein